MHSELQQEADARFRASQSGLAAKIGSKLGVELGRMTLRTFANGEVYCRYQESVRGADVFIVQPMCANSDTGLNANDVLMELLADDRRRGRWLGSTRVIAVTPWYGYSRQDKKSAPREPISAPLVARMLEAAGIRSNSTMDLHQGQIPGLLPETGRPHDGDVHAHCSISPTSASRTW